jgi:hypothetical protein
LRSHHTLSGPDYKDFMQFARTKQIDLNMAMEFWEDACQASAMELEDSSSEDETHAVIDADVVESESESDDELREVIANHTENSAHYWIAACARYKERKDMYDNLAMDSIKEKAKNGSPGAIWKWKNEM